MVPINNSLEEYEKSVIIQVVANAEKCSFVHCYYNPFLHSMFLSGENVDFIDIERLSNLSRVSSYTPPLFSSQETLGHGYKTRSVKNSRVYCFSG